MKRSPALGRRFVSNFQTGLCQFDWSEKGPSRKLPNRPHKMWLDFIDQLLLFSGLLGRFGSVGIRRKSLEVPPTIFFFQAKRKRNRRRHETFLANRRWRKENLKKNSKKRQGRAEASMDGLAGDKRRWWTEYWTTREQRNNVYIERQKKKHVWSDHHHP